MRHSGSRVDVVIVTECSFPYVKGGVGGVINQMITGLPDTRFGLIHLAWDETATRDRKYQIPANLSWIKNIYLEPRRRNASWRGEPFAGWIHRAFRGSRSPADLRTVMDAIDAATQGNYDGVRRMYRDYLNPRTRIHDLRRILRSRQAMLAFEARYGSLGMSLTRTFWLFDNFLSILTMLATEVYPDGAIYHAQTQLYAGLVAAMAATQNGRPMVLTEHGLNIRDSLAFITDSDLHPIEKDAWKAWFRHIGRIVYEEAVFTTYQFERNARESESNGLDPRTVRMISNGINLDEFARARHQNATKRPALERVWTIAYAGRIVEAKGILDLIEAIEILKKKTNIKFRVQIIGPSDGSEAFLSRCQQITKQRELTDVIEFTGPRNLSEALGGVDILVLPTHTDALPIVLLEAMASSVPVVATDVGAIMEVIANPAVNPADPSHSVGPAGIVVPPRIPVLLATAIKDLVTDTRLYDACRRNGPERIEINHRADKIMAQYQELYQEATRRQNTGYCGNDPTRLAKDASNGVTMPADTSKIKLNDSKVISM